MEKKIVKLAVIRDNAEHVCPFGLHIPSACARAGESVNNMQPVLKVDPDGIDTLMIKDRQQLSEIVRSNMNVLIWNDEQPQKCIYANMLFDAKPKVECNYGDSAAGIGHADLSTMPSYTQYFSAGYASVPIGFYSDHPTRNQSGNFEAMVSSSFASDETTKEKIRK